MELWARESGTAECEWRELNLARRDFELELRELSFLQRSSLTPRNRPTVALLIMGASYVLFNETPVEDNNSLPAPSTLCQPDAPQLFPTLPNLLNSKTQFGALSIFLAIVYSELCLFQSPCFS